MAKIEIAIGHQCVDKLPDTAPSLVTLDIYPLPVTIDGHGHLRLTADSALKMAERLALHAMAADLHNNTHVNGESVKDILNETLQEIFLKNKRLKDINDGLCDSSPKGSTIQ